MKINECKETGLEESEFRELSVFYNNSFLTQTILIIS